MDGEPALERASFTIDKSCSVLSRGSPKCVEHFVVNSRIGGSIKFDIVEGTGLSMPEPGVDVHGWGKAVFQVPAVGCTFRVFAEYRDEFGARRRVNEEFLLHGRAQAA